MIIFTVGVLLVLYSIILKQKYSVQIGMLFVLLIMGFQEGIPGDYMEYKNTFSHGGAESGIIGSTIKESEFAYIWLSQTLSKFMNFHEFVLLTSAVQCFIMGLIIKTYVRREYRYFGVLLIFFTFNIMMIQMKAMRQGYAMDTLLLAYYLAGKRKFFWSLFVAILAFGFHNSSIVALPFFLVLWFIMFLYKKQEQESPIPVIANKRKSVITAIGAAGGLLFFYLFKFMVFDSYITPILMGIEAFEYSGYLNQIENNRSIAWWILLYHIAIVFFATLYYVNEKDLFRKYFTILILVAMFLNIGIFGFGNLMRISAYFLFFCIVVYPNIANMLHRNYGKSVAVCFVLFNMAYIMYTTVGNMLSMDDGSGTGFSSYTFSFLNW